MQAAHPRSGREQFLEQARVPLLCGVVERLPALPVPRVERGASRDERPRLVAVVVADSEVQRRAAEIVWRVQGGALLNQRLCQVKAAAVCSEVQRGLRDSGWVRRIGARGGRVIDVCQGSHGGHLRIQVFR